MKSAMERRYFDRISLRNLKVRERNGDFEFFFRGISLNEESLFLEGRFCLNTQRPFSELQFTIPNGKIISVQSSCIVREELRLEKRGAIFKFLKMDEQSRIDLLDFIQCSQMRGTA